MTGIRCTSIDTSPLCLQSVELPGIVDQIKHLHPAYRSSSNTIDCLATPSRSNFQTDSDALLRLREKFDPAEIAFKLARNFTKIDLSQQIIGRSHILLQTLLTLLCREHQLILSRAGMAKTLYSDTIFGQFIDATTYKIQFTKGTPEEALVGPLDIRRLKNGEYVHNTNGSVIHAHFAFFDEIFNANDPALLSLNSIMQERKFSKGAQQEIAQLRSALAASNILRYTEQTEAVVDRYMAIAYLAPLSDPLDRSQMLRSYERFGGKPQLPPEHERIPLTEFDFLCDIIANQESKHRIKVPDHMFFIQQMIVKEYTEAVSKQSGNDASKGEVYISDRTNAKSMRFAKASALLEGRTVVLDQDLIALSNILAPLGHVRDFSSKYALAAGRVLAAVGLEDRKVIDSIFQIYDGVNDIRLAIEDGTHIINPGLLDKLCMACRLTGPGEITFRSISKALKEGLAPKHAAVHSLRENVMKKIDEAVKRTNLREDASVMQYLK